MSALILYSTTDGQTKKIAQTIAEQWPSDIELVALEDFISAAHYADVDWFIVGASIRYGHFNPTLIDLIKKNSNWLHERNTAFFSVNLTARKPGKNDPATSRYIQKFIHRSHWLPDHIAMFAGRLNYPQYRLVDKLMIQLIMKMTGGCADGRSDIEYTDWHAVTQFAKTLSASITTQA